MTFVKAQSEKFSVSYDQHLKVYQSMFLLKVQSKFKPGEGNISSSLLTEFELADNKLLEKWGHIHTLCYILLNKSKLEKHMNSLLLKKNGGFLLHDGYYTCFDCVCVCVENDCEILFNLSV